MLCQECGTPVECQHCHVSLTLHKARKRLICHYCGYSIGQAVICGNCRSTEALVPVGFGTERVEEEARLILPDARIARLDSRYGLGQEGLPADSANLCTSGRSMS